MNTHTDITSLTPAERTAIKICLRDHRNALHDVHSAHLTGNWASITPDADHRVLAGLKARGVPFLIAAFREISTEGQL